MIDMWFCFFSSSSFYFLDPRQTNRFVGRNPPRLTFLRRFHTHRRQRPVIDNCDRACDRQTAVAELAVPEARVGGVFLYSWLQWNTIMAVGTVASGLPAYACSLRTFPRGRFALCAASIKQQGVALLARRQGSAVAVAARVWRHCSSSRGSVPVALSSSYGVF